MALIPSESLNFPDGFRASVGWRSSAKDRRQARLLSHSGKSNAAAAAMIEKADLPVAQKVTPAPASVFEPGPGEVIVGEEQDLQLELIPKDPPIADFR